MLRSILISLTAESSYPILGTLGRPVQAWFLGQITRSNPALASKLHDEAGLKPYTVSTLLNSHSRPLRAGSWVQPGELCWIRITSLNEELSELIETKLIKRLPKQLVIHKMNFRVDDIATKPAEHEWAGAATFSEIAQVAALTSAENQVRMEFTSPTAFRSNGLDVCLPIPGQIFRSLWEKWNAFAPEPMQVHENWPNFANDCILVNELTAVNSTHWDFSDGNGRSATGFTGTVGFYLAPKNKVKQQWQDHWDGANVVLQSLAKFSFYSGVGHHTTVGMGQTRPLFLERTNKPELRTNQRHSTRRTK
jgi:CRISPR-associated endoribonuclease Cas6